MIREIWRSLGRGARLGLILGAVCLLGVTALAAYWLLRTDYQVLFADLAPQDAAALTAELEHQKVPYSLAEQGPEGTTSILVDRKDVYRTRMKVLGKEIPLHGAVGFELFNNSDFGMTEFAQRINYQRALQGELTRTILSLEEVRDARVLLALPEQGLFKQARSKATASVTMVLKNGRGLAPAQVLGIQRLVSAAVPGIAAQDVTIVDQRGVALNRAAGEADGDVGSGRFDLKRDAEQYLSRKADEMLERTLGPGQALASVDVTLDMDRIQTTTENVVGAPGASGRVQTGVVVRERETVRDTGAPLAVQSNVETSGASSGGSSQREVEYAVGRRVEQVVTQPGSIRRIQVVAVVKRPLDSVQQEQLRRAVAASVGAVFERGDTVVVQSIDALATPSAVAAVDAPVAAVAGNASPPPAVAGSGPPSRNGRGQQPSWGFLRSRTVMTGAAIVAVLLLGGAGVLLHRRGHGGGKQDRPVVSNLSEVERRAALVQVQGWIRGGQVERPAGGER